MSSSNNFLIENGVLKQYRGPGGDVVIPEGVTEIRYRAFYLCKSLTSVTIPASVTSIGSEAFRGCASLKSVTIPEGGTKIGPLAFMGCAGLQDEQGLVIVRGVLYDCVKKDVISVVIPDSVTSIGNGAFYGCSSLTSVTIQDGVTSIGRDAFCGCKSLMSVTIPEGVTEIGRGAFFECKSLLSVTVPDGVKVIENGTFSGCTGLTSVVIPASVTSIGGGAFEGCERLQSVAIPDGVTSIGYRAFSGCTGLTNVTYPGTDEQLGAIGFGAENEALCIQLQKSGREPSGACGETTTWRLAADGVLTIGGTGKMTSVPWLNYSGQIRAVVIGRGVEALLMEITIEANYMSEKRKVWANHGIRNLERFSVEEGSKSYASIDSVLFNKKLTRLESFPPAREDECYCVPESVKTIRAGAFQASRVQFVRLPQTMEKLPKGAFGENYVLTGSLEAAAALDYPVYLGDIEDLPAKVKKGAVQGFLYALAHSVKEMEPWADSYVNYIKRNSKTYIAQMAESEPLLRLMLEKKLLSESDVKTLLESVKGAEMKAALLTYQQEQFGGKKRKDEFSLDDSDPAMKRSMQTARRREQIKDQKGIAGLTFVATGELEHFGTYDEYTGAHDFDDLKWYIEERGGHLRSAVSSKTDYLICNDPASTTVKSKKAAELGVPVITEAQFLQMAEEK